MKRLTILLIFLLTAAFSFSQEDYPKLTLIDSDTLVLFTHNQVDKMNLTFLKLDEQIELNNSFLKEINLYNKKIILLEDKYDACKVKSELLFQIDEEKDGQVEILTSENKKQDKKIKLLKKMRNLYGIGGVIIGSVGTYFLTQILK